VEKGASRPILLEELECLPYGTLGQVFAEHCHNRGLNPNLVDVPLEDETDWLLSHLFRTHDIWHVMTGWANDEIGEVGLAGFYCGQLRSPPFFIFLYSLIMLKRVLRKDQQIDDFIRAFCAGYDSGRQASPLFGVNWADHWSTPLTEIRKNFSIETTSANQFGEGILAEAA
jgi:ubiquinone biosynthesis protein Coq4